jgi:hypothetical protein
MCRKASTKVDGLLPHEMRRLKQLEDENLQGEKPADLLVQAPGENTFLPSTSRPPRRSALKCLHRWSPAQQMRRAYAAIGHLAGQGPLMPRVGLCCPAEKFPLERP